MRPRPFSIAQTEAMVRIGFLGTGLIGRMHARRLTEVDDAQIVAGFDLDGDRSAAFAADFGASTAGSAAEVIDASDAVYVTTWTSAHLENVEAVVAAGKPVFCEKPLGVDLPSARQIVEVAESAGVINQVGLVLRSSPAFRWVRSQVQSGEYGPPMTLVFRDDQYIPTQGMYGSTWRGDRDRAGSGTLLEHSIHDVDLIEWILGPCRSVSAHTANHHGLDGIEDQASVLLDMANGSHALLSSTWHDVLTRPSLRLVEVFCQQGYFGLEGDWFGPVRRHRSDAEPEQWKGRQVTEMAESVDGRGINPDSDFVTSVKEGKPASPDFRTALRAHVVVDAAYRSAAQGGAPVEVGRSG